MPGPIPDAIGHARIARRRSWVWACLRLIGLAVTYGAVAASRQREFWVFSVSDNGIGIDPSQRDRVFQVFQRLHTRHEYPGTGIGLALCKRVVEGFGGRIWLEPQNGGGSRFQFTVPAGDGPDTASGAAAANTAPPSAHPVMASTGASRARP